MQTSVPKLIIAQPGTSRDNKTGSWRTFCPKADLEKCTGCGICTDFCPEGVITASKTDKVKIDLDFCKGCGMCAEVCPFNAITMEREAL